MAVSRRSFVATLGAGASGIIASPLISWRGHEALFAFQGVAERRADRLLASRPGMVRIDSNENPNGPGQHVFDAIMKHFGDANRYPTKSEDDLLQVLAKVHNLKVENFILGCGSGELLRAAVQAFTSPTRGLVAPEPTFEAPGNFARFINHPVMAPKVDSKLALDLNAMVDAAKNAGLVYFCNPNNPTATVHGASDVASYVDQVMKASPDAVVLIDEAYHEYVADPSYATAIPIALVESTRRGHADLLEGLRHGRHARRVRRRSARHAQEDDVVAARLERQSARARRGDDDGGRQGPHRRGSPAQSRVARVHAQVLRELRLHRARRRREFLHGGHPSRREGVQDGVREAQSRDRTAVPGGTDARAHLDRHDAGDEEGGQCVPHGAVFPGLHVVGHEMMMQAPAAAAAPVPEIQFEASADFLKLPAGMSFGEVAGIAVDGRKHFFVFVRTGARRRCTARGVAAVRVRTRWRVH